MGTVLMIAVVVAAGWPSHPSSNSAPDAREIVEATDEFMGAVVPLVADMPRGGIYPGANAQEIRCKIVAAERVSCRFLFRWTRKDRYVLRYQEFSRELLGWHLYPRAPAPPPPLGIAAPSTSQPKPDFDDVVRRSKLLVSATFNDPATVRFDRVRWAWDGRGVCGQAMGRNDLGFVIMLPFWSDGVLISTPGGPNPKVESSLCEPQRPPLF